MWRPRARPTVGPMTRTQRIIHTGAALCIAGGAAWLVKLVVLAATDGADSAPVAALWFTGAIGIVLGSVGLGVWLTARAPVGARIAAGVLSPLVALVSFSILDGVVKPLLEDFGPSWMQEEWGILATALLWLAIGLALRRNEPAPRADAVTSH